MKPIDIVAFVVKWIFTPKNFGYVLNNSTSTKKIDDKLIHKIHKDLIKIKPERTPPIIPEKIRKVSKYPLRTMEIGESFLTENQYQVVQNSVNRMHQISSKKFEIRRVKNGTRVWRIE